MPREGEDQAGHFWTFEGGYGTRGGMSRTRSIAVLFLLSALSFSGHVPRPRSAQEKPAQPPPATESPAFPSEVEVVKVDVVVTDKKGVPIPGLSRDAFTVVEDGVAQTITSFEAIQVPDLPSEAPAPRPR